jgi:hypothetical protein
MDEGMKEQVRRKWSWTRLFIKITSAAMWCWAASTVFVFVAMIKFGGNANITWFKTALVIWGIISCFFIGGKVWVDASGQAISKAEIKTSMGVGK